MLNTTDNPIRIIPLGGFGQVGMNCLSVEVNDGILLIDCGVMFPSFPRYGVEFVRPSFSYITENRHKIVGLVLTHGHEDHILAVPHLLQEVNMPVYGGAYTLNSVKCRLSEYSSPIKLESTVVLPETPFSLGPFVITAVPMPHSIVDNYGLIIDSCAGRIFHTGDFKLDLHSANKGEAVLSRLSSIGHVDVMISDSTGVLEAEDAGSESQIIEPIRSIVAGSSRCVYISLFSSNVSRISTLAQIAQVTGRKIAISGRSVEQNVKEAVSCGKIASFDHIRIPLEKVGDTDPSRLLVIMSGTQGEERSAMGRLASNNHRYFSVRSDDVVIFSNRIIPGNERPIGKMIDQLLESGATVFHSRNHSGIHVSGHGSRNEIGMAITAVAPRGFIPAHGTLQHLQEAGTLAKELGVPQTAVITNGQTVEYRGGELIVGKDTISVDPVSMEKGVIVSEEVLLERRIMGNNGIVFIYVSGQPLQIHLDSHGVLDEQRLPWLYEQIKEKIRISLSSMEEDVKADPERCQKGIRSTIRRLVQKIAARDPYISVHLDLETVL